MKVSARGNLLRFFFLHLIPNGVKSRKDRSQNSSEEISVNFWFLPKNKIGLDFVCEHSAITENRCSLITPRSRSTIHKYLKSETIVQNYCSLLTLRSTSTIYNYLKSATFTELPFLCNGKMKVNLL